MLPAEPSRQSTSERDTNTETHNVLKPVPRWGAFQDRWHAAARAQKRAAQKQRAQTTQDRPHLDLSLAATRRWDQVSIGRLLCFMTRKTEHRRAGDAWKPCEQAGSVNCE